MFALAVHLRNLITETHLHKGWGHIGEISRAKRVTVGKSGFLLVNVLNLRDQFLPQNPWQRFLLKSLDLPRKIASSDGKCDRTLTGEFCTFNVTSELHSDRCQTRIKIIWKQIFYYVAYYVFLQGCTKDLFNLDKCELKASLNLYFI